MFNDEVLYSVMIYDQNKYKILKKIQTYLEILKFY